MVGQSPPMRGQKYEYPCSSARPAFPGQQCQVKEQAFSTNDAEPHTYILFFSLFGLLWPISSCTMPRMMVFVRPWSQTGFLPMVIPLSLSRVIRRNRELSTRFPLYDDSRTMAHDVPRHP